MSNTVNLSEIPILSTKRLILRKLSHEDQNDIFEYASIPEVSNYLPWEPHKSIADTLEFLKLAEQAERMIGRSAER